MKILLPVDGSDYTKRMLSYLAAHDELLGTANTFHFLTVVAPITSYATRFLEQGTLENYYAEESERVLQPVRAYAAQHHWNYRATAAHGHAAMEIARTADAEKSDLIVMGSHGHGSLASVVMGSVTNAVLARCKVPLLLIR